MRNLIFIFVLICLGCATPQQRMVAVRPPAPEVPVANLPGKLHQLNWTDSRNAGSCVHASTVFVMRWQGQYQLAEWWRKTHAGGETATSITSEYTKRGLRYACTTEGDPEFLIWATQTRRGAIVWWKPYHCCAFVGISVIDGKEYAVIQDNNRPGTFEQTPLDEFIRRWRGYGGFACTLLLSPPHSPIPWPQAVPEGFVLQ